MPSPGATDSGILRGWVHGEDADTRAYVHHQTGVGVTEVERHLLALFRLTRSLPVVAFEARVVTVDVLHALDEAVQLVELMQSQVHLLSRAQWWIMRMMYQ